MGIHEHLSAIGDMTVAMGSATSSAEIFRVALSTIRRVTGVTRSSLVLFDADGVMRFKAWEGLSGRYRARVEGHTPWRPGQPQPEPIVVEDVDSEPTLRPFLEVIRAEGIRGMMMVPLVTGGGTIGKFMLYFADRHVFGEHEAALVRNIAAHTAFAVDRQRVVEALRDGEDRYRSVVDHLREVVFLVGPDGRWLFLNPAWEKITGFSLADSIGSNAFDFVHPDDRALTYAQLQTLAAPESVGFVCYESRWRTHDGGVKWIEVCAQAKRDADGAMVGVSGTMDDVTERRLAADVEQAEEIRHRESQRLESLGVLAGGIAHDFNNLLVGILSNASLALEDLPPNHPLEESLRGIELAGRRAAELTKQLLAYAGKGKYVTQRLSLPELVVDSGRLLAAAISKKATLGYHISDDVPLIEGDPTQLRQVAMNLLINASDALGDQPGVIHVRIESMLVDRAMLAEAQHGRDLPEGRYLSLEVQDSGCGMAQGTIARMFDPFFTSKFYGRGLGLAAVLGIVRAHKAAIVVQSKLGEGTTIRVLFPALAAEVTPPAKPPKREALRTEPVSNVSVLLVDDEDLVRRVLSSVLRGAGYTTYEARNGREALAWLTDSKNHADVVLLDLTMPELSGRETLAQIRECWPNQVVVLMSGYSEDAIPLSDRGSTGFLQKPFVVREVRDAIFHALDRSAHGHVTPSTSEVVRH